MIQGERTIWLVEIEAYADGVGEVVLRYSDAGFSTLPTDTPASVTYPAMLSNPGELSRTLFSGGTTFGSVEVGYGSIELDNSNGRLDALRTYGYGRRVTVRSITSALARGISYADSVVRFAGVVAYVEANFEILRLVLRDELGLLDEPFMPAVFDGTSTSTTGIEGNANVEGQLKTAAFGGFVRNLTPTLANASKEVWAWNHGIDGATAPTAAVVALRNGGATYTLSGTDHADEAALFAATVGAATADTALAESLLRVNGSVTAGLTADAYIAPEVENLILRSEDASDAAWTKPGATVSANAATAPDNADTADKIVQDSSTGAEHGYQQAIAVTAGDPVVGNFYLDPAEVTKARVRWAGASGSAYVDVDLDAGTLGTATATGSYSGATAEIEQVGTAYRVSVLCTTATDTAITLAALLVNGAGATSYDGDGVSGLYAWGAMGIVGTEIKPYIPTAAVAVTRRCEATAARVAEAILAAHGFTVEPGSVLELDRKAPLTVALYLEFDVTILEAVQMALESVGAAVIATNTGTLQFIRFEAPTGPVRKAINEWEIDGDGGETISLQPVDEGRGIPFWRVTTLYSPNCTPQGQGELVGSVSADDRTAYAEPWLRTTAEDASVLTKHPQAPETEVTTRLDVKAEAVAEGARRLAFLGSDKLRFRLPLTASRAVRDADRSTPLDIGDRVTFELDRFGLSAGEDFVVIGKDENFAANLVVLDILRSDLW